MIALEVIAQDKLIIFRELQVYLEFRLVFGVRHVFPLFATFRDGQSQALNSNFLRDKL